MTGVDSPVTVFNLIVSGILFRALVLKGPLHSMETSVLISIVIATQDPLIFPGAVELLPLVKLPIFTSLGVLFLPANTSPKVLDVFSFSAHFVEEISVVCFSSELVIEHDNRVPTYTILGFSYEA